MALVCDIKSEDLKEKENANDDLEDGEIEDDDDVPPIVETVPITPNMPPPAIFNPQVPPPNFPIKDKPMFSGDRNVPMDKGPPPNRRRHEEKKKGHLTEAEKSVMYLHKLERMEREKRDKYRRDTGIDAVDDFASNIEKAIANVLKKDKPNMEEDQEDDRRSKKRKKKDKDRKKSKFRKQDEGIKNDYEEYEDSEMLNMRGGSPGLGETGQNKDEMKASPSQSDDYDSEYDSAGSNNERKDKKGFNKKGNKRQQDKNRKFNREANREKRTEQPARENICMYNLQGKCLKGDDCQYSHEMMMPMKLELCKFYLMDCCAKGDKCLYMHSEFPCKYYHTGLDCYAGDSCKFAHGKPLSESLRQVLFKHIETAPKEILGDFPRLSREGVAQRITNTQKSLEGKYGPAEKKDGLCFDQGTKSERPQRQRQSRWQDPEPNDAIKPFITDNRMGMNFNSGMYVERDQDMRINSNGDVDMRTLPPLQQNLQPNMLPSHLSSIPQNECDLYKRDTDFTKDIDIREFRQDMDNRGPKFSNVDMDIRKHDVDIRNIPLNECKDVDIRPFSMGGKDIDIRAHTQQQMSNNENKDTDARMPIEPLSLPPKQRELFLRIQAQQKDANTPVHQPPQESHSDNEENINWYSDDDDELRLTIKVDDEQKEDEKQDTIMSPPQTRPTEVIEKLGDISKIEISPEVSELLSQITQASSVKENPKEAKTVLRDPRQAAHDTTKSDPRLRRRSNDDPRLKTEDKNKSEKLSIYEQGSMPADVDLRCGDVDLRSGATVNSDVDLRNLGIGFKSMQNYTPATEIDASLNSHEPIQWKVYIVDIPKPDYTGLKLTIQDAQTTGDPRLRKIFRLNSVEEKDSPASPKENSSKPAPAARIDPRRRKMEEAKQDPGNMSYAQQLALLQNSPFYHSLTSNQKVLLNQEIAMRAEQAGNNDSVLNGILSNLGLIPGNSLPINQGSLNILANVNNMNPMMGPNPGQMGNAGPLPLNRMPNQNMMPGGPPPPNMNGPPMGPGMMGQNPNMMPPQQMNQAGLLGPGPGMPNMSPDFPINFDPRNGGLLGNAPPPFPNYPENNFNNFNDDFYEGNNFNGNGGRGHDRGFRDRNRRGRGFNRGGGGRNFRNRNHHSNRSHSPP